MQSFDEKGHYKTGIRRSWIMAIVFISIAIAIGIFGNIYASKLKNPDAVTPNSARIEYQVTGSAPNVTISYLNDLAFTAELNGPPPWKFGFRASAGRNLFIKVDNKGSGTIGCVITSGGKPISTQPESVTPSATCMAVVPQE
ncbi:MAG: hypothetical protein NT020_13100 [Chloroflexales bacterium]|nr:hypothetical protein [Chloroflexales bacterium]